MNPNDTALAPGQFTGAAPLVPTSTPPASKTSIGNIPITQDVGAISNTPTLTTPTYTPPTNFYQELSTNAAADTVTATNDLKKYQTLNDNATSDFTKISDMLLGETKDTIKAENNAGLPQLNSSLRDLQTLSQRQLAAYFQQLKNNDVNAGGLERSGQNANEIFLNRQHGIDAMITNANISAVSGQIATARDTVDRAISLKYDPLKQALQNKLNFLNINKDNLTRADKKLADAKTTQLTIQLKDIEDQQQKEKDIQNVMLETAKNGAPISVTQSISKAKTFGEALQFAHGFISDPLERKLKTLQIAKLVADIKKETTDSSVLSIADAKSLGVPYGTTKGQAIALGKVPGQSDQANELKNSALTSAQELLTKFNAGTGTSAVGKSRMFGFQYLPGTAPRDFVIQFNNLKSLLSLDNVKYLKGQGQISDSERKLLADASSKLDLAQSETEFKSALESAVTALSSSTGQNTNTVDVPVGQTQTIDGHLYKSDGTQWVLQE